MSSQLRRRGRRRRPKTREDPDLIVEILRLDSEVDIGTLMHVSVIEIRTLILEVLDVKHKFIRYRGEKFRIEEDVVDNILFIEQF